MSFLNAAVFYFFKCCKPPIFKNPNKTGRWSVNILRGRKRKTPSPNSRESLLWLNLKAHHNCAWSATEDVKGGGEGLQDALGCFWMDRALFLPSHNATNSYTLGSTQVLTIKCQTRQNLQNTFPVWNQQKSKEMQQQFLVYSKNARWERDKPRFYRRCIEEKMHIIRALI